jgi:ketosteroid isomerase-like protein
MQSGDDQRSASPAQVVTELMAAIADARIGDMLALVHPDVVWWALARPGLTMYEGHTGMVQMVADISAAYGPYRIEIDDISVDTDTQVTVRVRAIRETDGKDLPMRLVTSVFTLRDGLVVSMEADPATDPR